MPNRTPGYGFQGCGPVVALSGVGLVTQGNPAPSCLARALAARDLPYRQDDAQDGDADNHAQDVDDDHQNPQRNRTPAEPLFDTPVFFV
jgi:hypothetical protein